ncbi:MAG: hypothetical protein M3Q95_06650 [Bacteroidota bacterium]|nr:hypothetical protein [Bacteroidota bacterium]
MGWIYSAIAVLGMTAIFGMYLLSLILRNKSTPKGVTIIHGVMASISLVLLVIYCFSDTPSPWVSFIVLVIAAIGGFYINFKDISGKPVPKWFAVVHGLIAVAGFGLLIWFAWSIN